MNIQYKIPEANMPNQIPDHLYLIVPSNPTHRTKFCEYEKSFKNTKNIGMISTKENCFFFISPRNETALRFYPEMQDGHLLGIYFPKTNDKIKKPEIKKIEENDEEEDDDNSNEEQELNPSIEMNLSAFD
jgi:IMP cyclohydrolase